jgi:hypothetical protein
VGDSIFNISLLAMLLLWLAAGWSAWKKSQVGRRIVFLIGILVVVPVATFSLSAELSDHIFQGQKPVGAGSVGILFFAGGFSLVVWLVGYWVASLIGWWLARRNAGA